MPIDNDSSASITILTCHKSSNVLWCDRKCPSVWHFGQDTDVTQ